MKSLLAFFRHPVTVRLQSVFKWLLGIVMLSFVLVLLLLRFVLLPQADAYRGDIEHALSNAIHLPVTIERIEARMQGIRPRLELRNLAVKDQGGHPVLSFDHVTGVVGWTSLLKWSPRFHQLEVDAPVLAVSRDAAGQIFVAGLPIKSDATGADYSAWVLDQHRIVIRDAKITWTDDLRHAPALVLDRLNLQIEKTVLGRHRFGMTAKPLVASTSDIDLRGEFSGDSINSLGLWGGELYGRVGHVDLAAWHPWVDYPIELTQGQGAAQVWLDFSRLQATEVSTDIALTNVLTRLAPDLPVLSLKHLDGRIELKRDRQSFELTTRKLSLATVGGIAVAPTNLHLQHDAAGGAFTVNKLDIEVLAALAAHLPLPQNFRQALTKYAPRGSLENFNTHWRGQQWPFSSYGIQGGFSKLTLASVDNQPGFSGISGTIEGSDDSGVLQLAGRNASLSLPTVFQLPILLDALDSRVLWKRKAGSTELELTGTKFHNADAEGVASGTYLLAAKGGGTIDLDARLSRANATAVWRYIPLQAGPDVGPFLEAGLMEGKATDVTLKLKGNLDKFPFVDRSGVFHVHGLVRGAVLRFAEDWPRIEAINGEIDFSGPGMTITGKDARINGVRLSAVKAEIPDLNVHEHQLFIAGKAAGATADFLKFIEASPVGAQIDHFTEGMTASGNGDLDLKLVLPLRDIRQSKVAGSYRFDANRLLLNPDMPPLEEVRGHLEFTGEGLSAKGITASIAGLPMKLNLKSQSDGGVLAEVSGEIAAAQLRKQFGYAGLKNLSGSARWNGTVNARKKMAEVKISSDLVGLSSALPEPFNKSAKDPMPLLIERKAADLRLFVRKPRDTSNRNVTELTLGHALRAQLIYRQDTTLSVFERGMITVGDVVMRIPERGLAVAVLQPRINVDSWRAMFADGTEKPASSNATDAPTPASENGFLPSGTEVRVDLRSGELQAMGRVFHDVKLNALRPANAVAAPWSADISSRELAAKLTWAGGANPKLGGRVTRLTMPEAATSDLVTTEPMKSLPGVDLILDHLVLKGRDYGELRLVAENKGADWNATYSVRNEDGVLEGQGSWRALTASLPGSVPKGSEIKADIKGSETKADFKMRARNIDKFLTRIGYPNTVKRGNADLSGTLVWRGAPQDFSVALLNGQLSLDARNGQFNKLEPGVARLLGILSLQSLPRRINLDFRDIFSDGFAFDSLKGEIALSNGVLSTQDIQIVGPAAKVQMAGSVDLNKETQDIKVRVQPKLGDSVAAGVLLASPAIGATAWVFNRLFGNPLDNVFAYDYAVTGSWDEPKVEKAGAQSGANSKGAAN